jgi:hypothetical protein
MSTSSSANSSRNSTPQIFERKKHNPQHNFQIGKLGKRILTVGAVAGGILAGGKYLYDKFHKPKVMITQSPTTTPGNSNEYIQGSIM